MSAKRWMTQAEFARHLGHARSWVTRLKQHGRLVLDRSGKRIDVPATLERIKHTTDASKITAPATAARKRQAAEQRVQREKHPRPTRVRHAGPDMDSEVWRDPNALSYSGARARREHAQAQIAEIELKKALRDLIPTADAVRAAEHLGSALRGRLERFPDEIAPLLAESGASEADAHRIMREAVEGVLNDLSSAFRQYAPENETSA